MGWQQVSRHWSVWKKFGGSATSSAVIPTRNSRKLIPDLCSKNLANTHMNDDTNWIGLGVAPEPVVTPIWRTQLWCYSQNNYASRFSQGVKMNWIILFVVSVYSKVVVQVGMITSVFECGPCGSCLIAPACGFSSACGHESRYIRWRCNVERSNLHVLYTDACN
jgi:hypothetical protein